MPDPICRAQSQVQSSELSRVQEEARKKFTVAEAVRNDEILSGVEWTKRLAHLTGALGRSWDENGIVRNLLSSMNTAEMPHFRTYTNVSRLVRSSRISDVQLIEWLRLSLNSNDLEKFRDKSQQILLGAKLFYYEYIPNQGTAWCYMPKSN